MYLLHREYFENFIIWINKNTIYNDYCKNLTKKQNFDKKANQFFNNYLLRNLSINDETQFELFKRKYSYLYLPED